LARGRICPLRLCFCSAWPRYDGTMSYPLHPPKRPAAAPLRPGPWPAPLPLLRKAARVPGPFPRPGSGPGPEDPESAKVIVDGCHVRPCLRAPVEEDVAAHAVRNRQVGSSIGVEVVRAAAVCRLLPREWAASGVERDVGVGAVWASAQCLQGKGRGWGRGRKGDGAECEILGMNSSRETRAGQLASALGWGRTWRGPVATSS
jgi:hypothetical protein